MSERSKVLVTGATGSVGRQVVLQLAGKGVDVRALSRHPATAMLPDNVDVVEGDLTDPDSLDIALADVDEIFLVWPFFTAEGAAAFLDVARKQVRRIVFLSSFAVADDEGRTAPMFHHDIERLIEQSGLEWTFVRPGGFASNTLMWADQIRDGVVRWPNGKAARSLIHEADIAAVAVLALTSEDHIGQTYALTGPDLISQIDQVTTIGAAIGRPVRWEELSRDAAREQLLAAWGDPSFVDSALDHWARLETEPEPITRTVEELTGTPARTFRQWAADHADDFASLSTAEVAHR